jgi:hypothetical protein
MLRSTASPPLERGALSGRRLRRERTDEDERQAMRPRAAQPARFAGRADGAQEHVANVCDRRPPRDQPTLKPFGGALRC